MLLAEMHAEIGQLRAELESTRAVAARLAGLLRSRGGGGALVPVHGSGTAATRQAASPAAARAIPPGAAQASAGRAAGQAERP